MSSRVTVSTSPSAERPPAPAGFTLVEMLLVVGIIATLMGILLPAAGRVRQSARAAICLNNLRSIGTGMLGYATLNRQALPWEGYAEGDRATRHVGPWDEPSVWFNAVPKYLNLPTYGALLAAEAAGTGSLPKAGDSSIFVCPEAEAGPGLTEDVVTEDGYFLLWGLDKAAAPVQRRTFWCYGYNTQLDEGVEDRNVTFRVTILLSHVRRPEETVLMAEKLMRPDEVVPAYGGSIGQQEISSKEFTGRHRNGGHVLFCDGHVAHFSRREVLNADGSAGGGSGVGPNQKGKIVWDPRLSDP
jgi:prepilin-type processing-associated H-X9-DG protein/prepilin-type N-terminal cleavage/methylation domain-containing protein